MKKKVQYNRFHNGDITKYHGRGNSRALTLPGDVIGKAGARQKRERKGSAGIKKSTCQGVEACRDWLASG